MGVRHARPFAARTPGGEKAWREALPESPGPRDRRLWSARLPRVASSSAHGSGEQHAPVRPLEEIPRGCRRCSESADSSVDGLTEPGTRTSESSRASDWREPPQENPPQPQFPHP